MARRKRRGEWQEMREKMTTHFSTSKKMDEREQVPDKPCGKCKNFSENAYASDGRGFCGILKTGSNILEDTPVYIFDGEASLLTFFNTNAEKCEYFKEMDLVDTDGFECADPQFRRAQRQMANKLS